MKNARPQTTETSALDKCHSTQNDLLASLKDALLQGFDVRLIDFAPEERSQVIGAIAALRDEFPINCRWITIRESHLSETRLRARSYHIKGEHLRSEVPA